jgi:WD40 repeat protein
LKVVKGHSHWVWNVEYNKFRDQLVLSSSTDSSVNLWKIATLSSSSEPLGIDDYRDPADTAYVPCAVCACVVCACAVCAVLIVLGAEGGRTT